MWGSDEDRTFHLFPRLPPEIKMRIWEIYLHAEPKDRIVLLNATTKRLTPTRHLVAPSLVLSKFTRWVYFQVVRPLRLPLYSDEEDQYGRASSQKKRANKNTSLGRRQPSPEPNIIKRFRGYLYIKLDEELFVNDIFYSYHLGENDSTAPRYRPDIKHQTLPLSLGQCKLIQNIMEVIPDIGMYPQNLEQVSFYDVNAERKFDVKVFSGVKVLYNTYWRMFFEHIADHDVQREIMIWPGWRFLQERQFTSIVVYKEGRKIIPHYNGFC